MRTALIDADMLVYHVAFASQTVTDGEVEPHSFDSCENMLLGLINKCVEATGSDTYILYLTGKGNFRHDVSDVYKSKRLKKPFHYKNLRAYMVGMLGAVVCDGEEADDVICRAQEQAILSGLPDVDTVICTADKDMLQEEGLHYYWGNSLSPERPMRRVGWFGNVSNNKGLKGEGIKFFFGQMVTGDTTDDIVGLKGKGPAAAVKLLEDKTTALECLEAVKGLYEEHIGEGWLEYFEQQGKLLWMLKHYDEYGQIEHFSLKYIEKVCEDESIRV